MYDREQIHQIELGFMGLVVHDVHCRDCSEGSEEGTCDERTLGCSPVLVDRFSLVVCVNEGDKEVQYDINQYSVFNLDNSLTSLIHHSAIHPASLIHII